MEALHDLCFYPVLRIRLPRTVRYAPSLPNGGNRKLIAITWAGTGSGYVHPVVLVVASHSCYENRTSRSAPFLSLAWRHNISKFSCHIQNHHARVSRFWKTVQNPD